MHVPTEEIPRNMVPFPSKVKIESQGRHFGKRFSKYLGELGQLLEQKSKKQLLDQGRSALDSSLLADFNEKRREKAHS